MPAVRTRCTQNPLEFLAGDDIGEFAIAQKFEMGGIIPLTAGGQNDRADGQRGFPFDLVVLDGLGHAHVFAETAADAGVGIDAEGQRNGLGIFDKSGPSVVEPLVVAVDGRDRTMPGALATSRTLDWIDVPRMVDQGNRKISRLPFDGFDFTVGDDIDVQMPADLDQFG